MLEPWIIDQIRRREEEQRRREERPVLEMPQEEPMPEEQGHSDGQVPIDEREVPKRGVVIIDYAV